MLETYSKNDISILKNSMLELNPNELECENLLSFIGSLDIEMTLQDKEQFIRAINPYLNQSLDVDNLEYISRYSSLLGTNNISL